MTSESEETSPYAAPTTLLTGGYHAASLVYCYVLYNSTNSVCFALGMVGSGGLASWGLWCLVFGGGGEGNEGRKRVSGWPFRNEREREVKRERMRGRGRKGL